LARRQKELDLKFDAVFLCGDVGTFAEESQLDNATQKQAKDHPCELEFFTAVGGLAAGTLAGCDL
jgi:hypothetical protein